jgi:hypothetical protein
MQDATASRRKAHIANLGISTKIQDTTGSRRPRGKDMLSVVRYPLFGDAKSKIQDARYTKDNLGI